MRIRHIALLLILAVVIASAVLSLQPRAKADDTTDKSAVTTESTDKKADTTTDAAEKKADTTTDVKAVESADKNAIDFTLTATDGKKIKLSDYRGKTVVLDIWATWCGYCVREIPGIIGLQQQAIEKKQNVQFIGISIDRDHNAVQAFAKRTPFNYPVVFAEDKVMKLFGDLPGVPVKFIINEKGVLVNSRIGAMSTADLQKYIAQYVK